MCLVFKLKRVWLFYPMCQYRRTQLPLMLTVVKFKVSKIRKASKDTIKIIWETGSDNFWTILKAIHAFTLSPSQQTLFSSCFPLPTFCIGKEEGREEGKKEGRTDGRREGEKEKRQEGRDKVKQNENSFPSHPQPAEGAGATSRTTAERLSLLWVPTTKSEVLWGCPCWESVVDLLSLSNGRVGGTCRLRSCARPARREAEVSVARE